MAITWVRAFVMRQLFHGFRYEWPIQKTRTQLNAVAPNAANLARDLQVELHATIVNKREMVMRPESFPCYMFLLSFLALTLYKPQLFWKNVGATDQKKHSREIIQLEVST